MAITLVNSDGDFLSAPTGNKTAESATTVTWSSSAGYTGLVDDVVVLCVAADNAGTSGASAFSSVDQPSTGAITWETAQVINRTAGSAANDGATLIILVGLITSQVSTSSTIALNWSPNVTAKAWRGVLVRGASPSIVNIASATGSGSSPTVTSGSSPTRSVQDGDIVIGSVAVESATGITTDDADTTNGSWTARMAATSGGSGGDGTKMAVGVQNKIVNANGDQTYNPSVTNTDRAIAIFTIGPAAAVERVPFYRPMTQLLAH